MSAKNLPPYLLASLFIAVAAASFSDPAMAAKSKGKAVDCANGKTVAEAVAKTKKTPATIVVKGACVENVVIFVDGITLQGDPESGGMLIGTGTADEDATIIVDGARGVVIDGLTVANGQASGIRITHGASATVKNSAVTNNALRGILVVEGSRADILDNTVSNNTSDGVLVSAGSLANVQRNTISGNGRADPYWEAGINVSRSQVWSRSNTVTGQGWAAVAVNNMSHFRSGTFLSPDTVDEPDGFDSYDMGTADYGLIVGRLSNADLRQVNVSGRIYAFDEAYLSVRSDRQLPNLQNSGIDDLRVGFDSHVRLDNVDINGAVTNNLARPGMITCYGDFPVNHCPETW